MNDTFNPIDWIEPDPKPSVPQSINPSAPSDQSQCSEVTASSYAFAPSSHHPLAPSSSDESDQSQCSEDATPGNSFAPSLHRPLSPSSISSEVDTVISRIESALTDITTSYHDWLNVGFALANEFGESGRGFFDRVSRFYSGYTKADCDRQFDQCLKSTPSSRCITIKTFFHLARQAGIDVTIPNLKERGCDGEMERWDNGGMVRDASQYPEGTACNALFAPSSHHPIAPSSSEELQNTDTEHCPLPTLPDAIFPRLPDFLQKVVDGADSREERDIMLLGALGVLSACFPKLSGIYDNRKVFSNLYLFITSPASGGKGRLNFCRQLVNPIHWELRKESQRLDQVFDMEMREYNIAKTKDSNAEKPEKPPELMFFIPANSTATGMYQLLADNEDRGLIFETEGDTLALAFKSDHGNYSDAFRKGAHHESISYFRRTDREYREIKHPCISAVLSGTPKQVSALIPSAENGLFSRFIFYYMNIRPVWKDVFANCDGMDLEGYFDLLGQEFFSFYIALKANPDMRFRLTPEQEQQFNLFFTQIQDKYITFHGMDYMGTIRRMGLIAFRMAMIFTALRIMETGDFSQKQVCSDEDFQSALSMVRILIKHSSHVFSELPVDVKFSGFKEKKEQFFDALPEKFTSQEFLNIAKNLSITERTTNRYIAAFCEKGLLRREQAGSYTNLNRLPGDYHPA